MIDVKRGSTIQVVSIGVLIVGVAVVGFAGYSASQSSPFLVQAENVSTNTSAVDVMSEDPSISVNRYETLSSSKKEIVDQVLNDGHGGATQVKGQDVQYFANTIIEHQGTYYTFSLHHENDQAYLTILSLGVGYVITGVGIALSVISLFLYTRGNEGDSL